MSAAALPEVSRDQLDLLVGGAHHDPHSILGFHALPDGTVIGI